MANLIGFNLEPKFEGRDMLSRSALLSQLVSSGVLSCASQEVKDLFHVLEHEFHPLDLGSKIHPLLEKNSKIRWEAFISSFFTRSATLPICSFFGEACYSEGTSTGV